jgi:hypothetical protein
MGKGTLRILEKGNEEDEVRNRVLEYETSSVTCKKEHSKTEPNHESGASTRLCHRLGQR